MAGLYCVTYLFDLYVNGRGIDAILAVAASATNGHSPVHAPSGPL